MVLQATRDIRKLALWLGHSNVSSTEICLRVDPTEKLEAVEAALPPSLRKGKFKAPDALIGSLLDRSAGINGSDTKPTPIPLPEGHRRGDGRGAHRNVTRCAAAVAASRDR